MRPQTDIQVLSSQRGSIALSGTISDLWHMTDSYISWAIRP
jgi:hypothetical protein